MKTVVFTILLCACHFQLFAQLQVPETNFEEKRNSLTIDYSSNSGIGIKYDRELIKKKKYSLVAQLGAGGNAFWSRSRYLGANLNFNAALYNRFTFGQHSLEAGLGVSTFNNFIPASNFEGPGINQWTASPYLHLGYMYQPKGKNWFLRANLQLNKGRYSRINRNLSVGFGFKF